MNEWYCDSGTVNNELWYLDKQSTGKFWIRNYYGSGGADARLTIFDCDIKDDHLWSFI